MLDDTERRGHRIDILSEESFINSLLMNLIVLIGLIGVVYAGDGVSMSRNIAIGICLGLTGGFIDNFGICLQKLSHRENNGRPYYLQPKWLCGIGLYFMGNILNATGLGMTPQSIFAALGSVGLVTNQ